MGLQGVASVSKGGVGEALPSHGNKVSPRGWRAGRQRHHWGMTAWTSTQRTPNGKAKSQRLEEQPLKTQRMGPTPQVGIMERLFWLQSGSWAAGPTRRKERD